MFIFPPNVCCHSVRIQARCLYLICEYKYGVCRQTHTYWQHWTALNLHLTYTAEMWACASVCVCMLEHINILLMHALSLTVRWKWKWTIISCWYQTDNTHANLHPQRKPFFMKERGRFRQKNGWERGSDNRLSSITPFPLCLSLSLPTVFILNRWVEVSDFNEKASVWVTWLPLTLSFWIFVFCSSLK